FSVHFMVKLMLGLLCLFSLVAVNLTGLLVQSVFYFACKSHHNEMVDKKVLHDHLCGNKSVALNPPSAGSIDMQSLVKDQDRVDYHPVALNATTEYVLQYYQDAENSGKDDDTVGDQNVENEGPKPLILISSISLLYFKCHSSFRCCIGYNLLAFAMSHFKISNPVDHWSFNI
ncbi:hypothetical protein MKX03_026091, partial [Papaver bracteatum]